MFGGIEQSDVKTNDNYLVLNEDLSFFKNNIHFDVIEDCLEVINNLQNVARKLGVENTRKYLIPFLINLITTEEVPGLNNLAVILGDFEYYVGGPKYAHVLLIPLEELANAKLSDVRMAAIRSLQTIANIMEVPDLETYFIPLIANMTISKKYNKRSSVCHLFTTVYMRVSSEFQGHLIEYYCYLNVDSVPCVRQDAAKCLVDLSDVVCLSIFDIKLIHCLEKFSCDQNEHVRISALSSAVEISKKLDVSFIQKRIFPVILNFINDPSWESRLILIKNISKLLVIDTSFTHFNERFMPSIIALTKDRRLEVRLQSVSVLYECTVFLHENLAASKANTLITKFSIAALCDLCQDPEVKCRLEVLTVLSKLGKILPYEIFKDYFVNLVETMLEDKNFDVVFNVIKCMKDILGSQCRSIITLPEDRLVCSLKAFIINDSWEIRNTGAIYLGILAVQLGHQFFEKNLKQIFLILLSDTESIVQQTTIDVFKTLVKEYGIDWAYVNIMPFLTSLSCSKNYNLKMTFLSFAKVCTTIMSIKLRALYIKKENVVK